MFFILLLTQLLHNHLVKNHSKKIYIFFNKYWPFNIKGMHANCYKLLKKTTLVFIFLNLPDLNETR